MLGITYTTVKDDDHDGLSYPHFLDALLEMAFECGRNVAADLQAGAAARRKQEEAIQVHMSILQLRILIFFTLPSYQKLLLPFHTQSTRDPSSERLSRTLGRNSRSLRSVHMEGNGTPGEWNPGEGPPSAIALMSLRIRSVIWVIWVLS